MGDVVMHIGYSIDGYIEGPDHDISWHRVDEELHQHMNDVLRDAGAFLEGRVTWQLMADYWPAAAEDPDSTPVERDFARIWVDKPKYLYSRTLESAGWGSTLVREVDPEQVLALKERHDGELVVGGPHLAHAFRQHDLIDAYRLYVHPIVLGRGTPAFFPYDEQAPTELVDTQVFGNGVVMLHHRRVR